MQGARTKVIVVNWSNFDEDGSLESELFDKDAQYFARVNLNYDSHMLTYGLRQA
ncbi:hypothetical protein HPP92_011830 [Vanilla planifolia]|uniref:Uncharacterized protein n=1 Tax=Vanilla planifolia TaxID=51239 RepID=A0A835R7T8_VANPL|nr:hypothetical protein HPP92_011830 [Vanilla planifolia]